MRPALKWNCEQPRKQNCLQSCAFAKPCILSTRFEAGHSGRSLARPALES